MIAHVETECRSCGSTSLQEIIAFGSTPLADRLLRANQLNEPELAADLTLAICESCSLVQILETVDPEILFFAEYPYFSSVSPSLTAHFAASAEAIMRRWPPGEKSLVVEAASNDGYMLRNFVAAGIPVLGIDPAAAPASAAIDAGIPTWIDFFGLELARRIVDERGHASVFLGNNVLAHVPDLNGFVAGIAELLDGDGVAVIEAPYVVDLVDHCEFDTIYHQHLCYFSVTALDALVRRHGLYLNDIERTAIHGGSLRLFIQKTDDQKPVVAELLTLERDRGFDRPDAYHDFSSRVAGLRESLRAILDQIVADGGSIVGYGAAAKATTLMAYCGIDSTYLDYVCDLNEYKQGRFMGGNHLAIKPPFEMKTDPPDYILILAWNFAAEIMAQNDWFAAQGGKFIIPVPAPHVVGSR